jgi:hypothetical protein
MTEVGETVVAKVNSPRLPMVELEARILELKVLSDVDVSLDEAQVKPPHWVPAMLGEDATAWSYARKLKINEVNLSSRPAASVIGTPCRIEVTVKVTRSQNVAPTGTLTGALGSLGAVGKCPTAVGTHAVLVTVANPPTGLLWVHEQAEWTLTVESPAVTVSLERTLIEVFFILGKPLEEYIPKVFVEVLRFLFAKVKIGGESDERSVAVSIARYCFGEHVHHYQGMAMYAASPNGNVFRVGKYILKVSPDANCHDQAAALQALCGALGIGVTWGYLEPFGFIKPTYLIGYPEGQCNNPDFVANPRRRLVPPADPGRTPFRNHAFVSAADGLILDACAGPHLGTETLAEYAQASIDDTPSLYAGDPPSVEAPKALGGGLKRITWDSKSDKKFPIPEDS